MTRFTFKYGCGLGVAALFMTTALSSGAALAQTTPQGVETASLGEVIVTAQKRSERLSLTPLSVTALSSKNLEAIGATEFSDFANTVPGLTFTTTGAGQNQINLRGVTSGAAVSPTVAVYVDEVPYGGTTFASGSGQLALDVALFDVDRVEILRGPQGTLYGASSEGGLLKYVTVLPDTHNFTGEARAGVSGTDGGGTNYTGAAAVNIPLFDDKAGLRVSGFYNRDGGYIDNTTLKQKDVNQADIYGGRVDLLLRPIDKMTVRLTGFSQDIYRDGTTEADFKCVQATATSACGGETPVNGSLNQSRSLPEPFDNRYRLISADVGYDLGDAKLTSITSYQSIRTAAGLDYSTKYGPLFNTLATLGLTPGSVNTVDFAKTTNVKKFTQELRIDGTGPVLDWLVGGFYTHEAIDNHQELPAFAASGAKIPFNYLTVDLLNDYQEIAAFGTLTYHITKQIDLTGGLRYGQQTQQYEQNAGTSSPLIAGSTPERQDDTNSTTYLANLRYRPTDYAMFYLRYATGYRPGGPNAVANNPATGLPLASATYAADTLKSYEGGVKANTPDHKYTIDLAGFDIKWDNFQIGAVRNGVGVLANAKSAESKGAELTLTGQPIPPLNLSANMAYTDAELTADAPDLGGKNGDTLPDAPKFTGAFSADYTLRWMGSDIDLGGTVRTVGSRNSAFLGSAATPGGAPAYHLPSYTSVDLRAGFDVRDIHVLFFIKNVGDERGQLSADTTFAPVARVAIMQPRTIGVNVTKHF
jgi:iron complex outermembrane receptor protein